MTAEEMFKNWGYDKKMEYKGGTLFMDSNCCDPILDGIEGILINPDGTAEKITENFSGINGELGCPRIKWWPEEILAVAQFLKEKQEESKNE